MYFIRTGFSIVLFILLRLIAGLAVIVAIWWLVSTPSHERNWRADYAKLPTVEWAKSSTARISNVRDWLFTTSAYPLDQPYIDKTVDIDTLSKTWFMVEPFSEWDMVGHTFFLFEFSDGTTIVSSIEARREVGEEYSILKGLLPYFEYMIVWTTERDMFTNTTYFANDNLYRYPLTISLESQKKLLTLLLERTHELETRPRFYNLLSANCTNLLATEANKIKPGSIPYHYSWILTGYADSYLHSLGFIPNDIPFDRLEEQSLITPHIRKAAQNGHAETEQEFAKAMRSSQ